METVFTQMNIDTMLDLAPKEHPVYNKFICYRDGRIFSKYRGVFLNRKKVHNSYVQVCIKRGSKYYAHRIIAEAFIPNPQNKPYVNHKNGIKYDNRVENLEWVCASENAIHANDIGLTSTRGQGNPMAKLENKDIENIFRMRASGAQVKEISIIFKVHIRTIFRILAKETWGSVSS